MSDISKINPMVRAKFHQVVHPNLETISKALAESQSCKIVAKPGSTDTRELKFSDLFAYKQFLEENELGTLVVNLSGPLSKDAFLKRLSEDYIAKSKSPNASIADVFKRAGKLSVKYSVKELGKAILKAADAPKPAKAEKTAKPPKAEKPKAEKAAKPVNTPKVDQQNLNAAEPAASTEFSAPAPQVPPAAESKPAASLSWD